jgi:transcriptional regulator with GAF, ATPase, and Fis domain
MERLVALAEALGQQNDFNEILRVVAQQAASLLSAETALIMMINPQTHQTVKAVFKTGATLAESQYHLLMLEIGGWVAKNCRSLLVTDIHQDLRFRKKHFQGLPIKSAMCVALRLEGVMIGSLLLLNQKRGGAFSEMDLSYLEKFAAIAAPFLRNVQKIRQYFAAPLPETALRTKYANVGLLGKSKKFIELLQAVEAAARCEVRVLLEGQSGTGKELIARAIHRFSARHTGLFVAIDCGAIPANLLESEIFGHVKGAFTGATSNRKGLLEDADQGTLFMDEIANLPLDMQAKFMRVLQEGEIRPLGSNKPRKVEVRIISASSVSLREMVERKQFREDLYFRLHVYPIYVPTLRERSEDIHLLAGHFLKKFAQQQHKQAESFHEEISDFMRQRPWEGNIRELENFVERLVTLAGPEMPVLNHEILPAEYRKEIRRLKIAHAPRAAGLSLSEKLTEYEAQLVRQALLENNWNQSQAARALGVSEQTIRYKMARLGIKKLDNFGEHNSP